MPNTLGKAVTIDVFAQAFIDALEAKTVPLRFFTKDFSSEVAVKGASVTTQVVSGGTSARTKTDQYGTYIDDDSAMIDVTVTLDNHLYKQLRFSNVELAKAGQSYYDRFGKTNAEAMSRGIQTDLHARITNANFSNSFTCAASAFNYDKLVELSTQASNLNWPTDSRVVVLKPSYTEGLKKDAKVLSLFSKTAELMAVDGYIGKLAGFEVFETNSIESAYSAEFVGYAAIPSAIAIAARLVATPESAKQVMNTKSVESSNGLSMDQSVYFDANSGQEKIRWELLMGSKKADGNALIRIK